MNDAPRRIPRWIDALIVVGWAWLLIEAWFEGQELPALLAQLPVFPTLSWPIAPGLVAVAAVTALATFHERRRLSEEVPLVTKFVDRRFGEGTYHALNERMRPVLLSMLGTVVLAISCASATQATPGEPRGHLVTAGAVAAATGLCAALLLSRRYPPVLK